MSRHPAVRVCTCNHVEADHSRARSSWPHPVQHGPCLVPGCPCEKFVDADRKDTAA